MGGATAELNEEVDLRPGALGVGGRHGARVPGQGDVQVIEQAGAGHVELADERLLGRAAVEADSALELAGGDLLLDGDGGPQGGGPEQVMAAAVAGAAGREGLPGRLSLLGQPRQGVVLAQQADDWPSLAEAGNERGGEPRDAVLDAESLMPGEVGQVAGRPPLAQGRLGVAPDAIGQGDQLLAVPVDGGDGLVAGRQGAIAGPGGDERAGGYHRYRGE